MPLALLSFSSKSLPSSWMISVSFRFCQVGACHLKTPVQLFCTVAVRLPLLHFPSPFNPFISLQTCSHSLLHPSANSCFFHSVSRMFIFYWSNDDVSIPSVLSIYLPHCVIVLPIRAIRPFQNQIFKCLILNIWKSNLIFISGVTTVRQIGQIHLHH